jgi:hypothetical protein
LHVVMELRRNMMDMQRNMMDMQRTIGELVAKTDYLIVTVKHQGERSDAQSAKINAIQLKLAWLAGATAVVGALLAAALAMLKVNYFGADHWTIYIRRKSQPHGHFTLGGSEDRMLSMLPPVFKPNKVPRS